MWDHLYASMSTKLFLLTSAALDAEYPKFFLFWPAGWQKPYHFYVMSFQTLSIAISFWLEEKGWGGNCGNQLLLITFAPTLEHFHAKLLIQLVQTGCLQNKFLAPFDIDMNMSCPNIWNHQVTIMCIMHYSLAFQRLVSRLVGRCHILQTGSLELFSILLLYNLDAIQTYILCILDISPSVTICTCIAVLLQKFIVNWLSKCIHRRPKIGCNTLQAMYIATMARSASVPKWPQKQSQCIYFLSLKILLHGEHAPDHLHLPHKHIRHCRSCCLKIKWHTLHRSQ